jgi:hypothetical protein
MAGIRRQCYDWLENPERESLPVVVSNLQFICPLEPNVNEPSIHDYSIKSVKDVRQTDVVHETRQVLIRDIRGVENSFNLECDGFEVLKHRTQLSQVEFASKAAVMDIYLKETEALLKERFHASRVVIIGCVVSYWKFLSSQINSVVKTRDNAQGNGNRLPDAFRPAKVVHIGKYPQVRTCCHR